MRRAPEMRLQEPVAVRRAGTLAARPDPLPQEPLPQQGPNRACQSGHGSTRASSDVVTPIRMRAQGQRCIGHRGAPAAPAGEPPQRARDRRSPPRPEEAGGWGHSGPTASPPGGEAPGWPLGLRPRAEADPVAARPHPHTDAPLAAGESMKDGVWKRLSAVTRVGWAGRGCAARSGASTHRAIGSRATAAAFGSVAARRASQNTGREGEEARPSSGRKGGREGVGSTAIGFPLGWAGR